MRTLLEELTNWEERPFPRVGGSPGIGRWQCHKIVGPSVDEACDHHNGPSSNPSLACLWLVCPSPAYSHSDTMYPEVLITVNSILGITVMSYIKLFMKCTASGLCGERETERQRDGWHPGSRKGTWRQNNTQPYSQKPEQEPLCPVMGTMFWTRPRHAVSSILKKEILIHASTWISGTMSQTDPWQTKREKVLRAD